MNNSKERDFDALSVESRQHQELDALERENDALWTENENLRQEVQKLQLLAIRAEWDAEQAYTCMHLLLELLPKGTWRKKAQRAVALLTQKRQRRFPQNRYLQVNQFHSEGFDGYDGWGGYAYEDGKQKEFRNQRRRPLFRR